MGYRRANVKHVVALLVVELLLCSLIVKLVPYTEIDWSTYMQQVNGFLQGERDYSKLGGSTGPLVYPAGFLYAYTAFHWLSAGGLIHPAQILFVLLYLVVQGLVMGLYIKSGAVPAPVLLLLCLSKRIHSIFMLRMFNDGLAMLVAYAAIWLLLNQRWRTSILFFSAAVSVKMNVLLMAPGVLIVLLKESTFQDILQGVGLGSLLQIFMAAPFLLENPTSYLTRAFDFSRVFMYRWTVNLKFLPEEIFQAKSTAVSLLLLHISLLMLFVQQKWCRPEGGLLQTCKMCWQRSLKKAQGERPPKGNLRPDLVMNIIFTANFLGVICARSLHYQFYSWYFHMLPYLLWQVKLHAIVRCGMLLLVEIIWNIYPPTFASSACLAACHIAICIALLSQPLPPRPAYTSTAPARLLRSARNR